MTKPTTTPHILAIYIASMAGEPMRNVVSAEVVPDGIKDDRYASGMGAYSKSTPNKIRHISLISTAGMTAANEWLAAQGKPTFTAAQTRRNILIDGISAEDLNDLIGKEFRLGKILLKGVELCDPCHRPAQLVNKPDFINAFDNRGGLRAEIQSSGTISVGDRLNVNL